MSKRYDHARVEHYRAQKILPLALLNYITSAGGGFHRINDESKMHSMAELIQMVQQFIFVIFSIFSFFLTIFKTMQIIRMETNFVSLGTF